MTPQQNHSAPNRTVRQYRDRETPDSVVRIGPRSELGASVPALIERAPVAFQRAGYSVERLRQAWGISRRQAVDVVLAGVVEALIGPPAHSRRVMQMRRAS